MAARFNSFLSRGPSTARSWQERRWVAYPIFLLLAVALVMRGNLGPPRLHGDLSLYWVWADQFTSELARGNLYPRWMSASDGGLGTSVFYFYPPLAFYLTGLFGLLGASTYTSLICAFGVAFAASGIGCWHWLEGRSNHPLLAAGFFMAAPYHVLDYTERASLPESVAIALIPFLAIGLRRIAERRGGVAMALVVYGAMIATHLPLALLVSVFLVAPYALAHRRRIASFSLAAVGGIGLSAIYLVPAFALSRYRDLGQLYRTSFLQTGYWSIFSGHWNDPLYTLVFVILATIIVAAILPALRNRDRWAFLAIGVAIVVSGVLPYFWSLPLLENVQFPYRAIPIAEFALATALSRMPRDPGPVVVTAALPLIVSILVMPGISPQGEGLNRLRSAHPDAYEYLPDGVIEPGRIGVKLKEVLAKRVPPPSVAGMVVEPHFYFPAWSCGTEEPRTQLLMHRPDCAPRIVWTWAEKLGAAISLLTALMLAAWSLPPFARRKLLVRAQTADYADPLQAEGGPAFEQRASDCA